MAMTDVEVQRQINHMIAFIEQEGSEKAEEIDAKTEEEFNIEKGRIIQEERKKIKEIYDKKEKAVELQWRCQTMSLRNKHNLEFLQAQYDSVFELLEETRDRLQYISKKKNDFKKITKNLILQALYKVMEPHVVVQCRKIDVPIINEILSDVTKTYKDTLKRDIDIQVSKDNFLSNDIAGGVEVTSLHGRIKVTNTLDSRLDIIFDQLMPRIRDGLLNPKVDKFAPGTWQKAHITGDLEIGATSRDRSK